MNELLEIYLEASGGKYGDQKGIFAVRDHVIAEMKAKLDRAERALKRAGYQESEWKPPLGLSVQAIRNAWLDAEVVGNSWDGAKAVLDLINKKEISTGKAFQMRPGTMTKDEALEVVMAGVDQVEALARVLRAAPDKWWPELDETWDRVKDMYLDQARAAIAHLSKRPEVSTKPVDLWTVITSIVDVRVDCDGCDYVEIDRTSVSDLEVALRPWLRDPVGLELDVTADVIEVIARSSSRKTRAQEILDLCRSRIRPTFECDCSAIEKERDLLKAECRSLERQNSRLGAHLDAARAALEGE